MTTIRATCPACQHRAALAPAQGRLIPHTDTETAWLAWRCPACSVDVQSQADADMEFSLLDCGVDTDEIKQLRKQMSMVSDLSDVCADEMEAS